ncbi:MAG: hypothetical protein IKY26_04030 [Erysipelotrichaceae bacterium]|nr:hypothetical protein [Erysipelotrichaceae bacterium]
MIIDHTNPIYAKKRNSLTGGNKYNGAYYYSREIVKNIIPNVKTDRNWVTVRLREQPIPDHSIVFIHNNRNPNYYEFLSQYKDLILVCGLEKTVDNMQYFGKAIYLPLSVDVKSVERYKVKEKTKEMAFAGRLIKISKMYHAPVPKECDILTNMPQYKLLKAMADYRKVYCTGRTAIQAKILECEIGIHDRNFPDARIWKVLDNKDAAKILQTKLNEIDKENI